MNHSPAEISASFLKTVELFTEPGGEMPLYIGSLPDELTDAAVVIDTAGRIEGRRLPSGVYQEQYGIQIKLRSSNYKVGWVFLQTVCDYLSSVQNETVTVEDDSYVLDTANQTSPVFALGQDEKRREMFTTNFLLMIR